MIRLFLNTLRSLKNQKVQTLGLMILVIVSTLLYSMMTYSNDVIYVGSDDYFAKQNQEDFTFVPKLELTEATIGEIIQDYQIPLTELANGDISQAFTKYKVDFQPYLDEAAEQLASEYEFTFEPRVQKMFSETVGDIDYNFLAIKTPTEINKPYVVQGTLPATDTEVAINEPFLKANGLSIGDTYDILGKTYTISASVYDVDQVFPIVSMESPLYMADKDAIVHFSDAEFDRLTTEAQTTYAAVFTDQTDTKAQYETIDAEKFQYIIDIDSNPRVSILSSRAEMSTVMSTIMLAFLSGITAIMVALTIRRQINNEKEQIGVLKALGYRRAEIMMSYFVYAVVIGFGGALIGYWAGYALAYPVSDALRAMLNMPAFEIAPLLDRSLIGLFGPMLIIGIVSWFVSFIALRHQPIWLLSPGSDTHVNGLAKLIDKMKLNFKQRFRYSLASRGYGRLFMVFFGAILSGILINYAFLLITMIDDVTGNAFGAASYNSQVTYTQPYTLPNERVADDEEPVTMAKVDFEGYTSDSSFLQSIDSSQASIELTGIMPDTQLNRLLDVNGRDITAEVENGVVINTFVESGFGIEVGDVVTAKTADGKTIDLEVMAVTHAFNGNYAYTDIETVNELLGYDPGSFNSVQSPDDLANLKDTEGVLSVMSLADLVENMTQLNKQMTMMLGIFTGFAAGLGLIMISLVSNFSVDDNRKVISLLKVMGYNKKEISSIALNIYTPVVLLAYLVSIPAALQIVSYVTDLIGQEIGVGLPVRISWPLVLIGLVIVLVVYYLSIKMAQRSLNRVSLQEALKK
ncbi:MAG: ABC transporter permease [Culicoidibacterales bacterium]